MKLKKLLVAATAVALVPSVAGALTLTATGGQAGSVVANEVSFAGGAVAGSYQFDVGLTGGGTFAGGQQYTIDVYLPSHMTYTGAAAASDVPATGGTDALFGNNNTQTTTTGATATYLYQADAAGETTIGFDLPLTMSGCPTGAAPIRVDVFLAGTTVGVNGGSVSSLAVTPTCVVGVVGAILTDETTSDTQAALPA